MPDQDSAPGLEPESAETAPSLRESYQSALNETGIDPDSPDGGEAPKEEAPPASQPEQAEEPEHIRWAKSVDGNYDKASGQLLPDRLAKQAYELNKFAQPLAQELAKYRQVVSHPQVQAVLQAIVSGQQQPQKDVSEKTDMEIFEETVAKKVNEIVNPIVQRNQAMYQRHLDNEYQTTHSRLQEKFGKEGDAFVYDQIATEVGQQMMVAAQRSGATVEGLLQYLAENGVLYETLETAASRVLYPKLQERLTAKQQADAERELKRQKGATLTGRGSSSKSVSKQPGEVNSFEDAWRLAEEELAKK